MKPGSGIFKEPHVVNQKIWESFYLNVFASILVLPPPTLFKVYDSLTRIWLFLVSSFCSFWFKGIVVEYFKYFTIDMSYFFFLSFVFLVLPDVSLCH